MTVYDGRGRETKSFKKNALGEVIHCSETSYDLSGHPVKLTQAVFSGPYALKTITHQWVYDLTVTHIFFLVQMTYFSCAFLLPGRRQAGAF